MKKDVGQNQQRISRSIDNFQLLCSTVDINLNKIVFLSSSIAQKTNIISIESYRLIEYEDDKGNTHSINYYELLLRLVSFIFYYLDAFSSYNKRMFSDACRDKFLKL